MTPRTRRPVNWMIEPGLLRMIHAYARRQRLSPWQVADKAFRLLLAQEKESNNNPLDSGSDRAHTAP